MEDQNDQSIATVQTAPAASIDGSVGFEELVLCRLAFDPEFGALAFALLGRRLPENGEAISAGGFSTPELNVIFGALRLYIKFLGHPTQAAIVWELLDRCVAELLGQAPLAGTMDSSEMTGYIRAILAREWKSSREEVDRQFIPWLRLRRVLAVLEKQRAQGAIDATLLSEEIKRDRCCVDRLISATQRQSEPQDGRAEGAYSSAGRMTTGIRGLDQKLGGGLGPGEGYLFIGATGAGKTALACQLTLSSSAKGKKKGLLILTEEREARIMLRMVSNGCNIPYSRIVNGFDPSLLDPVLSAAYKKLKTSLQSTLRIVEWRKGMARSVMNSITEEIERAREELGGLDYLVLDWIGGALGDAILEPEKLRTTYQEAGDYMGRLAREEKIVTVTLAQAHVDRGIDRMRVDSAALAECKQLGREMVGIVGISAIHKDFTKMNDGPALDDNQYASVSKARFGETGLVPIRREMSFQRFR